MSLKRHTKKILVQCLAQIPSREEALQPQVNLQTFCGGSMTRERPTLARDHQSSLLPAHVDKAANAIQVLVLAIHLH